MAEPLEVGHLLALFKRFAFFCHGKRVVYGSGRLREREKRAGALGLRRTGDGGFGETQREKREKAGNQGGMASRL